MPPEASTPERPEAVLELYSMGDMACTTFTRLVTSLVGEGCSLSQLDLNATSNRESFAAPTQDKFQGQRQHICDDPNVYVRKLRTYMQTSEQTVFPGRHTSTAIAR